jgi:hypothetical protein
MLTGMVLIPYEFHKKPRMDREGRGHMLTGMVLIPYEIHRNLQIGPRRQRAYAHQDGAHNLRIQREFTEWTATAECICSAE